jgi:hypothetical protein
MATKTQETDIPADVLADLEEVCRLAAEKKKPDLDLERRIGERTAQARQEMFEKFGIQDMGVAIIREMRDTR